MAKEHYHTTLKKLLGDLNNRNFDDIKYATYRAAVKLLYIQRSTNFHLVDIYNLIEAFRENGMNAGNHDAEVDEARLECVIASIYFALHKRLPASNEIDVEFNIVCLTQWLLRAYGRCKTGLIRTFSIKVALTTLCSGRLIDKLRYVFTQISDTNGMLNSLKFDEFLKEILELPAAIGERPNFTYTEETSKEFFKPCGILDLESTNTDQFLQSFMTEKRSGVLYWLHVLNKLMKCSTVQHDVQCKACGRKPFTGLRYKCLDCFNYQLCQDCFWRERISGSHSTSHDMREFSTWNKGERGVFVKKRLLCSPSVSQDGNLLPDYPSEPEPIKTLDMTNIVPAISVDVSGCSLNSSIIPITGQLSSKNHSECFNCPEAYEVSHEIVTRMDDEHRLIVRYAQRLASETESEVKSDILDITFGEELSKEQFEVVSSLEDQNRSLLREIRKLKVEHEQTVRITEQVGNDPNVMVELKVLRQRKDELEMRMSALQETRRELMVQLEGLMKLLKNNHNFPRDVSRTVLNREMEVSVKNAHTYGTLCQSSKGSLFTVNGDVKQAFGNNASLGKERDLRDDLFHTVDDITSFISVLVEELSNVDNELPTDTSSIILSTSSTNRKYEELTRDLDLIMNELSATQATQNMADVRSPVISC